MRIFIGVLALLSSAVAVDIPFTLCGDDKIGLEKVTSSDYPVKAGETVDLQVIFTPKQELSAGTMLDLKLSLHGIKLYSDTIDACKESGVTCPMPAGKQVVITATSTVPKDAPKATIDAHITGKDASGAALSCVDFKLTVQGFLSDEEMIARPAVTEALIADIRMRRPLWTPTLPKKFANASMAQAASLCGTVMRGNPGYMELPPKEEDGLTTQAIPDTFDSRENWVDCKDVIGHIRDQSACGSCWAFATTEAFNDRLCINKQVKELLSPTDTTACCRLGGSMGCNGGQPSGAWSYFTTSGIVTGGDEAEKGKGLSCLPYPFPSCAHHVDPDAEHPACPSTDYKTPACKSSCSESSYATDYRSDKHMAKTAYSVRGVSAIQTEIMTNGPVSAAFTVYQDFLTYKSGVYHHVSGSALGGHAVKMVGWGTENGTPYWLIANSWNSGWGDAGLFKIKRGTNECGIEGQITAGSV